ncbi:MAG: hypothetical protein E4G94_00770 [ANME-2 cluster archaeon]|nr:MAG: hypothetical protein E4G94_00770 [ANME-2 cluster archaeon]
MKNFIYSENAVSEAIGFVLTLGIVLLASGIVYAGGLPILQQSMESTHFMEMEESFLLLAQNINEVAYERGPVRSTELKILQGSMSLNHDSSMQITVNDPVNTSNTFMMGSVEYYLDNKIVAYENGGVWVKYETNTIMRAKPQMSYSNVTTIPIIEIMGDYSKAGEGSTRIRAKYSEVSSTYFINATGYESNINITSSFYEGWARYLEDDLGAHDVTVDDSSQSVSANITSDYIYVDLNRVDMEIF